MNGGAPTQGIVNANTPQATVVNFHPDSIANVPGQTKVLQFAEKE